MTFFHKVLLHFSVRSYSCDFDREQTRSFFDKTLVFSSIFLSFLTPGADKNVIIMFITYKLHEIHDNAMKSLHWCVMCLKDLSIVVTGNRFFVALF